MTEVTRSEISIYYNARMPGMAQPDKREWRSRCPVHSGDGDNFSVNSETGLAVCHSQCGRGWDIIALEMELRGMDFATAKASVFEIIGRPSLTWDDRDVEGLYDYVDPDRKLVYQVVRKYPKKFLQRQPAPGGGWIRNLSGVTPIPYRLPELIRASFVAVTEGEKDADNLSRFGIPATCNNGGAGNFKPGLAVHFVGKRIAIFPDFDETGRKHALMVAALLAPVATSLKIVELPGMAPKGDISDWITAGGTLEQLRELYSKATEFSDTWEFSIPLADPLTEKYIHTFRGSIEAAGGQEKFWNLAAQEGTPTPWAKLTRALGGGMRKSEVYVIGGNQGSGKTSLALQFGLEAMRRELGVLYFSMEMAARDIFQRLAAIEARLDLLEFRDLQRTASFSIDLREMKQRLVQASQELAVMRLLVSTKSAITPEYVLEECTRVRSRSRLDLVIVDHMQLMSATGNVRGDYEKFTAISRTMKQVATELELPVLLVSQTTRNNSIDKRSELEVNDLRGSGAIEEDAAAVMLLFPDAEDRKRTIEAGTFARGPVKTWLKLGKNRYGLQGMFLPLLHFKTCTRFDEANTFQDVQQEVA